MLNWKDYFLDDLAYYYNGMAFKPNDWKSDGVKIIRIEQINNPNGGYDYYQGVFPDNNSIDNGDLIFSWSATLKVVIWKYGKGVLNQHLFKVIPKDFINKHYLYFLLDYNMPKLSDTSHGSTMKHIKRGELKKYKVSVPEYPIQQKIAKILSTIDRQIEKTETIIAKYQAVKQGMIQDLFTRGIDLTTGELRPRYEDAPELYKDSPLGMIPREWEAKFVGDIIRIKHGHGFEGKFFTDEPNGYILLTPGNFSVEGGLYFTNSNTKYYKGIFPSEFILNNGDVLNVMTDLTKEMAILGKTVILDKYEKVLHNQRIGKVIFDESGLDKTFLNNLLNSDIVIDEIKKTATGTTVRHTSPTKIYNAKIGLPKKPEQKLIGNRIEQMDNLISDERQTLNKCSLLKQGLMSDLLSGKVEVNN